MFDQVEISQILQEVFGEQYDTSFVPFYYAGWAGYEDDGHVCILERDGQFYELTWGYSPMADCHDDIWVVDPIESDDAVIALIEEWEQLVQEDHF